jgi:hypothetical protein
MREEKNSTRARKVQEGESADPVQVIRKGSIAAGIWQRQSPSGYAYYDFSLSRSWKSVSTDKTGYSKNFFETNDADLIELSKRHQLVSLPTGPLKPCPRAKQRS